MPCDKTGFQGYLIPYDIYVRGDAFRTEDGSYVFRICAKQYQPMRDEVHYLISDYESWFDKDKTSQHQNSTMICNGIHVENLGYDGKSVSEVEAIQRRTSARD